MPHKHGATDVKMMRIGCCSPPILSSTQQHGGEMFEKYIIDDQLHTMIRRSDVYQDIYIRPVLSNNE
jgi:hypothetical protein